MALIWSSGALDDLDRIAMFNEQFSEARATEVNWRIMARAASLADAPYRGRPVGGDLREVSLTDIQYVITYAVSGPDLRVFGVRSTREQRGRA